MIIFIIIIIIVISFIIIIIIVVVAIITAIITNCYYYNYRKFIFILKLMLINLFLFFKLLRPNKRILKVGDDEDKIIEVRSFILYGRMQYSHVLFYIILYWIELIEDNIEFCWIEICHIVSLNVTLYYVLLK